MDEERPPKPALSSFETGVVGPLTSRNVDSQRQADLLKQRTDMATEGIKALMALNGAGAVAMLAFLQAQWGKPGSPILGTLIALVIFTSGVAITPWIHVYRARSNRAYADDDFDLQRQHSQRHQLLWRCSWGAFCAGSCAVVVAFAFGLMAGGPFEIQL